MIILLSPAKSLVEGPALPEHPATQPTLLDETTTLLETARTLDAADLQALMSISEPLGALNAARFQALAPPFTRDNARQAAFLFDGDVYRGLDVRTLPRDALAWAQDHVGILSGLYGLLRPLDLIQPYRLEMGTRLATPRGADLYAFWGRRITDAVRARLAELDGDVVVDLASQEYSRAVKRRELGGRWITPVFQDVDGGRARTISFFAKRARGAMTRWAAERGLTDPEGLKDSDALGYRYDPARSTDDTWVFTRPKPAAAR